MVTTVLVIFLLLFIVIYIFLNLYQIEKKNVQIFEQKYELRIQESKIHKLEVKLKEASIEYTNLYEEYEQYKQMNPTNTGKSGPTNPYELVNDLLTKGVTNEME